MNQIMSSSFYLFIAECNLLMADLYNIFINLDNRTMYFVAQHRIFFVHVVVFKIGFFMSS